MSGIRVIAGAAKGRRLKMVPGQSTRPVMDRVKEAVFNIIGGGIVDSVFLDLFGGTGSVGIEALSRGAAQAAFVDADKFAVRTIRENLALVGFEERATVLRGDALEYLKGKPLASYDYIYIAPPQYKGLWAECLRLLDAQPDWLNPDGWAIAQIDPVEYEELELQNLTRFDKRKYGNTLLGFYERGVGD
jgi:16S rRNA (guanine(966)-N(2))-methyltransferase RsmD